MIREDFREVGLATDSEPRLTARPWHVQLKRQIVGLPRHSKAFSVFWSARCRALAPVGPVSIRLLPFRILLSHIHTHRDTAIASIAPTAMSDI
jgi:hypothetical protein